MEDIFGKTYNKKRLAPGGITEVKSTLLLHNCTTLGGNSGSAVVDLDSGEALGLHFSGSFLATNYAVPRRHREAAARRCSRRARDPSRGAKADAGPRRWSGCTCRLRAGRDGLRELPAAPPALPSR